MNLRFGWLLARLQTMWSRVKQRPLETWLAALALMWGVFLLLPMNTFASTPTFASMARLGPEWGWGIFIFIVGAAQLAAIGSLGRYWLLGSLVASAGLWFFVSAMLIAANPAATSTVVYPLAALGSLWRLSET